jgi:hypothetical protein
VARPIAHRSAEWSAKNVVSQTDSADRDLLVVAARPRLVVPRPDDFRPDAPRRAAVERLVVTVRARYRRPSPDPRIPIPLPTCSDAS